MSHTRRCQGSLRVRWLCTQTIDLFHPTNIFQLSLMPAVRPRWSFCTSPIVTAVILGVLILCLRASAAPPPVPASDLTSPNITGPSSSSPPSLTQSPSPFTRANAFGMFLTIQICQLTQPYGSLLFHGANGWFWRVSPIASFLEGCIIATSLIFSRDRSWRSSKGFNVAAAALLLLRNSPEKLDDVSETTSTLISSTSDGDASIQPHHDGGSGHSNRVELDGVADAHKEWRIALFTAISVLMVFIKLCSVTGVPAFTTVMMGLLFGWMMVQSLLLLCHGSDMTEDEVQRAIDLSGRMKASQRGRNVLWQICFIALHLPLLGYAAWFPAFRLSVPHNLYGWLCRLLAIYCFYYIVGLIIFALYTVCSCSWNWDAWDWRYILLYSLTPIVGWLMIAGALDGGYMEANLSTNSIFVHPFRIILRSFALVSSFLFLFFIFAGLIYSTPHGPSVAGFFITGILFLVYLLRYDSSGTSKPNWTDWLG